MNQAIIGSDSGFLPACCQAIISTNGGLLLVVPLSKFFSEMWMKYNTFYARNKFHNAVCKIATEVIKTEK